MCTASRQVSPPSMTKRLDRVNTLPRHTRQKQIISIPDSETPKTPPPTQLSTLAFITIQYTKGKIKCTMLKEMRDAR